MKKQFIKRTFTLVMASAFVSALFVGGAGNAFVFDEKTVVTSAQSTGQVFDENNIKLTVATITDPHIGYEGNDKKLNNTLSVLKDFAGEDGIDVFLSAGDNTQDGTQEQAAYFMEILGDHFDLTKVPAVVAHGNHDVYWQNNISRSEFFDVYNPYGMYTFDKDLDAAKGGNRHIEFEGYHFLTVDIQTYMPNINNLNDTTKSWLSSTLAAISADNPDEPIFVVSHSPQINTIHGSILATAGYGEIARDEDTAAWGASKDFDAILNNYPQAILISGHTHYPVNNELSIMQTGYTSFTPGGAADLSQNKDTAETAGGAMPEARTHSQGTLMQIDKDNNVRIIRIDMVQKKQIKQPWIIPAPKADKSHLTYYSAARGETNTAPTFASAETLDVTAASASSMKVTYPKASDDDMVYSYRITVKKGADGNGGQIASVTTLSPWIYYPDLSQIPQMLSHTFASPVSYPCVVEVVAIDCWGKESAPLTKTLQDPTPNDILAAGDFDNSVTSFGEVNKNSYQAISALRAQYNAMSYTRKARVTKYAQFKALEKQFYQTYAVSEDVKGNASAKDAYFNMIPSATRGTVADSDFCGVDIKWTGTTMNSPVGLNTPLALDGLTIAFGGLDFSSDNKVLGFMFSSLARDRYTASETLLVQIDFATGTMYVGGGNLAQQIGKADCLLYDNVVSRPVQLQMKKLGEAYTLTVSVYGMESETFALPADAIASATNLTDTTAVFASVTPWAKNTHGEMNLYAVYNQPTGGENSGCGSATMLGVIPALAAVAFCLGKKRN